METGGCVCGTSAAPGTGHAHGHLALMSGCVEVTPSRSISEAIRAIAGSQAKGGRVGIS